ncbi:MAG: hypothetical protein U0326_28110 [Polyangiales bacterium]
MFVTNHRSIVTCSARVSSVTVCTSQPAPCPALPPRSPVRNSRRCTLAVAALPVRDRVGLTDPRAQHPLQFRP